MTLNELFDNQNNLTPVSFVDSKELYNAMYPNLERAQNVSNNYKNWKTGSHSSDVNYKHWKTKINKNNYISDDNYNKFIENNLSNTNYSNFLSELSIFINKHPEYTHLEKELTYLAKLESEFKQDAFTKSSTAMGWFQFLQNTRKKYNNLSKDEFIKDGQEQLDTAAKYYSDLQNMVKNWGGNPNDFPTMYLAWWHPSDAKLYIQHNILNTEDRNGITAKGVFNKALNLIKNNE